MEIDIMPGANGYRLMGEGLHPRHYDALRNEILRTGAELSDAQLIDLTDALDRQVRRRQRGTASRAASGRAALASA